MVQQITVDLHQLNLSFQSSEPQLMEYFEAVYGHLPRATEADITIQWQLTTADMAPPPPPKMPILSEDDLIGYYGDEQLVAIRLPKYGLIIVDLAQKQLSGSITRRTLETYGVFEDIMMISLAPLYRRRGWFPLHAFSALAPNGQAILISGEMGSGKTTTGLALLTAGWKLLSNDSPLLCEQEGTIQVLAYPGRLSAFDDSLARFDRLKQFIPPFAKNSAKRVFRAEEAFPDPWATAGPAGGLFFPHITPDLAQSELIRVAPSQAVLHLLPQAVESWDKSAIKQHLHLLSRLAEQVPCYHLKLSPYVEQLPELILEGITISSRSKE